MEANKFDVGLRSLVEKNFRLGMVKEGGMGWDIWFWPLVFNAVVIMLGGGVP